LKPKWEFSTYKEFSGINWIDALNKALEFWKENLAHTRMIDFIKFCSKCREGDIYYILYNDKKGIDEQKRNKERFRKYFGSN